MKTGERLMKVETEMKGIKKSLDEHKKEQREDFDLVFNKLDNLNGKFAGKWVEKIALGSLVTIIGGIAIGLIMLM